MPLSSCSFARTSKKLDGMESGTVPNRPALSSGASRPEAVHGRSSWLVLVEREVDTCCFLPCCAPQLETRVLPGRIPARPQVMHCISGENSAQLWPRAWQQSILLHPRSLQLRASSETQLCLATPPSIGASCPSLPGCKHCSGLQIVAAEAASQVSQCPTSLLHGRFSGQRSVGKLVPLPLWHPPIEPQGHLAYKRST